MKKCSKCDEYYFRDNHHCEKFTIIDEDGEEYEQYGFDERDAAIKYAEDYNVNGDYSLMGSSVEITVGGKKFRISAEADINYSASEVNTPTDGDRGE